MFKVMFEDFRDEEGPYVHASFESYEQAHEEFDILSDLYAWEDWANVFIVRPGEESE